MRHTSIRRHKTSSRRYYRGAGGERIVHEEPTLLAPDDADYPTIICLGPGCGVRVKMLASGKPRSHAAGGYSTSAEKGRFRCEGSGGI